jgi:hypothetical protein
MDNISRSSILKETTEDQFSSNITLQYYYIGRAGEKETADGRWRDGEMERWGELFILHFTFVI